MWEVQEGCINQQRICERLCQLTRTKSLYNFVNMPALLIHDNRTMYNPPSLPPNQFADSAEPRLQALLFNTITVVLAAASLVVTCLHFLYQRNSIEQRVHEYGMSDRTDG